jgi:hypothetical protein
MQAFSELNLRPSKRDLVQFALVIGVCGGLLGLVLQYLGKPTASSVVWWGTAALLAGSIVPGLSRLLYIAWMGLGVAVGMVTGPILMFVVYLVVFTPLALVFRLARRDAMHRTIDKAAASYWTKHPPTSDVSRYYKQY